MLLNTDNSKKYQKAEQGAKRMLVRLSVISHRITVIECNELEGTHQDHCIQILAFKTLVPESIAKTCLQLCQAGAMTISLGSLFQRSATFWGKNFFLISNLNLLSLSFTCALESCHWSQTIQRSPPKSRSFGFFFCLPLQKINHQGM